MVILGMWHICMAKERDDQEYMNREFERLGSVPQTADITERRGTLEEIIRIHRQDLDGDWDGEKFYSFLREVIEEEECSLSLDRLLDAYRFVNLVETLAKDTGLLVISPPNKTQQPLESLSSYVTAKFLQKKDEPRNKQEQEAWRYARDLTLKACDQIYGRLNITLARKDVRGESDYDPDLPQVVADLKAEGLLTVSQGAQCVFLDEFKGKDGEPLPVIVQKSDGAYLYSTTDLAAMRYRVKTLGAGRIMYVVDARQSLHFKQVFAVARKAGFVPAGVSLEHVAFGTMMDKAGRPFKTREGGTLKLTDLLEDAEQRAFELVSEKSPDLPEPRRREIARAVGIGAVKYADLSQNRASDYVFSWAKMLSFDGNTAPYMQYAYARVSSIFGKAGMTADDVSGDVALVEPAERVLGVKLMQFPETVQTVAVECLPNVLCAYLFDLAGAFMSFYEACPVLKADDDATRTSRLVLCKLTAQTIETGLDLLGIETIEQM